MISTKQLFFGIFLLFIAGTSLQAQSDTSYYKSYTHLITARAFLSQKYTALTLKNEKIPYNITYLPNSKFNFGIGASYKWATFNLATGIGYLDPDDGKGKTKYIDLQFHKYGQKVVYDFVAQFYTGFYLFPKGTATSSRASYYSRPDLKVTVFGGTAQYVFNNKRFSFQSTYLQTEWQKKSAGSFLAGIETYSGRMRADSALVPSSVEKANAELSIDFFEAGINFGYAYTLVIHKHFFVTASAAGSLDYSTTTMKNADGNTIATNVSPNTFFRFVTGYNREKWAFHIIYINNGVRIGDGVREAALNTGNLRLSYARRFALGSKERKALKIIN
ncbi:DUF4421 domain-containing protein [soil metagenome]